MKILVTPTSMQPNKKSKALDKLRSFSNNLVFNPTGKPLDEDALIDLLKDCDGYIAGLDFVTNKVIDSCKNLKAISRYGAGYDRVDIAAAKSKGILVANTPGVNAEAVGELAIGLILSTARKIPYLDSQTRSGGWVRSTGLELKGKTIGILGLGAIGKVVARCAQGLGMHIIAYDPFINASYCQDNNISVATFEEVISESDVISLHLPLTPDTKHLINENAISRMKDNIILVNTSRGGIIDEEAAYQALKAGKMGGLGLDAFEMEPPKCSPLFELNNVVVTPHNGAHTQEATENMAIASVDNLINLLTGNDCPNVVNR
ncbi:MAG: phosphoglycerate dehydrogenase [Anaerocolumna sp.]|jgi:D-3-phosphoglycerate dehydrogenase|nr:phosphoglycerate dehydrogenase [Anaerocolumna sp.]